MATEKILKTRVLMKTDTTANWSKATNFIPKAGEIIVYSDDARKIKVGDGTTKVSALKFVSQDELAKITTLGDELDALEMKVDNISVGGRNLLTQAACKGSPYYAEDASWRSGYGVTLSTTSDNPTFQTSNLNGGGAFAIGETYTLSFTAKADGTTNVYTDLYPDTIGGIFGNAKREVTTTPRRIVMTDVLTSSADLGNVRLRFWRMASEPKYAIQIWDIKLEKGNKSTDWSPAPEDLVPTTRTVNSKPLSSDISLTASDVGALPLAGGTISGDLTVNGAMVAKAGIDVFSNSYPFFGLFNADASKRFMAITANTSTGDYCDVKFQVNKDANTLADFIFGKDGTFTVPSSLTLGSPLTIANGGTGSTTASGALSNLGGLAKSGGTMSGELNIKNGTRFSQINFAGSFDSSYATSLTFDAGNTGKYGSSTHLMVKQYSITTGATSSSGMNKYEAFHFPGTASGLSASADYTIITTKNLPSASQVGALPISGGTLTGTLTVPTVLTVKTNNCPMITFNNASNTLLSRLYVNTSSGDYGDFIVDVLSDASTHHYFAFTNDGIFDSSNIRAVSFLARGNTRPNLSFLNTSNTTLAQLYSSTTDGSYGDVLLKVHSSTSNASTFTFAKDGTFGTANNIYSKGTLVSQTNSYPGLAIQNASGVNLAILYSNGTTGKYSNAVLRVYSSASAYSSYSFGNDGSLNFGGKLYSGSHSIQGDSFPALSFANIANNKTYAYIQPQTSAGEYADVRLTIKNSGGQSNFLFAMNGDLTVPRKLYAGLGQSVKSFDAGGGTTGYIKFATIKISANYQNQTIRMAITQRSRYGDFKLTFANVNNTDPSVLSFVKTGSINVFIHKSATSTWDLYIRKAEAYDQVDITVFENGTYNSFNLTWSDTFASELPSGYIEATFEAWGGVAASANTLNNTLSIAKGGTGATTASAARTALGITPANIGAATSSHTHSYLPLSGGTVTGTLTVNSTFTARVLQTTEGLAYLVNDNSNVYGALGLGNTNYGDFTEISCADDGSLSVNDALHATYFQVDGTNNWPSIWFKAKSKTKAGVLLQANANHQFGFYLYGADLDTASTRYFESYVLPAPATGLTANKNYTIYSTKNIVYSSSKPTGSTGMIWLKPV